MFGMIFLYVNKCLHTTRHLLNGLFTNLQGSENAETNQKPVIEMKVCQKEQTYRLNPIIPSINLSDSPQLCECPIDSMKIT